MRRFLLTLMILMLPLRGWMGDAMAVQEAGFGGNQHNHATFSVAKKSHHTSGEAHFHAENFGMMDAHANMDHGAHGASQNHANGEDGEDHAACHLCDVCHSSVVSVTGLHLTLRNVSQDTPVGQAPSDTSAAPTLRQKPPIS